MGMLVAPPSWVCPRLNHHGGDAVGRTRYEPTGDPMADDLRQTGKSDDSRIDVDQDHELRYWSEKFGVSRDELRKAVQAAGPVVKDVQRHLNR